VLVDGLRRAWVVFSVIWLLGVLGIACDVRPKYNARYHEMYPSSYLDDLARDRAEFDGYALATAIGGPSVVYALGAAAVWVVRGFRKKPTPPPLP
jgi:hypothetical protein